MKKIITALLFISFLFSACHPGNHRVRGNGKITTSNHEVSSFSNLKVRGNFDVYVTQDSSRSVRIEADENLMKHILVRSENNTLYIEPEKNMNLAGSKKIKVYVTSPAFKNIDLSGACAITAEDTLRGDVMSIHLSGASDADMYLDAPKVNAVMSGASGISLKGRTKEFSIDGSGATKARCSDLLAENVEVEISGAGSVHVFASVKLNVQVSGAASVHYRGNASVVKEVSGAGSVSKED